MNNKNLDFSAHLLRKGWEQYGCIKTYRNLLNKNEDIGYIVVHSVYIVVVESS